MENPKSPKEHLMKMRIDNGGANAPVSAQLIYIAHKYAPKESMKNPGTREYKAAINDFYYSVLIPVNLTRTDIFIGIRYLHINRLLEEWVNVDLLTEHKKEKETSWHSSK